MQRHMSQPLGKAVAVASVVWLGMFVGVSFDYFGSRTGNVEQATVTAVALTGDRTDCGRSLLANTDEEVVTFAVSRPPPALPPTFSLGGLPV